ncbi:hypothetical protein ACWGR4_30775 [Embleya sp. NPDC055664]
MNVLLDGVGGELGTRAFVLAADGGRVSAHGTAGGGFAEVDEATVTSATGGIDGVRHRLTLFAQENRNNEEVPPWETTPHDP